MPTAPTGQTDRQARPISCIFVRGGGAARPLTASSSLSGRRAYGADDTTPLCIDTDICGQQGAAWNDPLARTEQQPTLRVRP